MLCLTVTSNGCNSLSQQQFLLLEWVNRQQSHLLIPLLSLWVCQLHQPQQLIPTRGNQALHRQHLVDNQILTLFLRKLLWECRDKLSCLAHQLLQLILTQDSQSLHQNSLTDNPVLHRQHLVDNQILTLFLRKLLWECRNKLPCLAHQLLQLTPTQDTPFLHQGKPSDIHPQLRLPHQMLPLTLMDSLRRTRHSHRCHHSRGMDRLLRLLLVPTATRI